MKLTKIYTRTGDKGMTSLVGGIRIKKSSVRLEAYGTVDELCSHIGLLRRAIFSSWARIWPQTRVRHPFLLQVNCQKERWNSWSSALMNSWPCCQNHRVLSCLVARWLPPSVMCVAPYVDVQNVVSMPWQKQMS